MQGLVAKLRKMAKKEGKSKMTGGRETYVYLSSTMSCLSALPREDGRGARVWSQERGDFTISHRDSRYLLLQDRGPVCVDTNFL